MCFDLLLCLFSHAQWFRFMAEQAVCLEKCLDGQFSSLVSIDRVVCLSHQCALMLP